MRPTVRIAFDLSLAGAGDFFTLDDPVKGELDGTTFKLAGDILTDISDDVRSVSVRRGRANETDEVDTGIANIELDNRSRSYDPTAAASVSLYGPSILPRKLVSVEIDGAYLFSGQVEDWDLLYTRDGDSTAVAECADGFALLAQRTFAASAVGATGLSGSVIYDSASVAGWPLGRTAIDDGNATIGAHNIDAGQNVLEYLKEVAGSEPGLLFIDKEGRLRFRERDASQAPTGTLFADDGTGIPFRSIEIDYGTELLHTRVEVEYIGGSVSAENTASIDDYGVTTLKLETLLGSSGEAQDLADFLVQRYGKPVLRITGLSVEMDSLTPAQQQEILGLELGDGLEIKFTPNGIGQPIERTVVLDSVRHDINLSRHDVTFDFSQTLASLILDDTEQGILDENTLGF